MSDFDLHICVRPYGGKDPRKKAEYLRRIQLATRIETYLAAHMGGRDSAIVSYAVIAEAMGCSREIVRELVATAGGGETGITLKR